MQQTEAVQSAQQYLTFLLAGETYGLNVLQVREILDLPEITRVPKMPEHMLGVVNLRGQVTPVVDLRRKFRLEGTEQSKETCIIVVEIVLGNENLTIGIVGDAVEEVLELPQESIEPPPKIGDQLNTEFILGMGKRGERFVLLLDIDRIFSHEGLEEVTLASAEG